MEEYVQTVISWVKENCLKDKPNIEITAETQLLVTNILDSLDFLNLVEFVQEQYSIEIDEDEMSPDNFESPETVANLIASLKG